MWIQRLLFLTCNNKLHLGYSSIYISCSKMYLSNDLRFCDCVTNRLKRHKCAFIHHYVNGYFLWIKTFCQSHCCGLNTKFMVLQHIFCSSFYPFNLSLNTFFNFTFCVDVQWQNVEGVQKTLKHNLVSMNMMDICKNKHCTIWLVITLHDSFTFVLYEMRLKRQPCPYKYNKWHCKHLKWIHGKFLKFLSIHKF